MISEYKKIYDDLYENISDNLIFSLLFMIFWPKRTRAKAYKESFKYLRPLLSFTKKTIDKAIDAIDENKRIRPDAKYYLLINFYHMVAVPLTLHKHEIFSVLYKENVENDVKIILAKAIEMSPKKNVITTTDIIKILPKVWDNLGLNKIKVWGKINE